MRFGSFYYSGKILSADPEFHSQPTKEDREDDVGDVGEDAGVEAVFFFEGGFDVFEVLLDEGEGGGADGEFAFVTFDDGLQFAYGLTRARFTRVYIRIVVYGNMSV